MYKVLDLTKYCIFKNYISLKPKTHQSERVKCIILIYRIMEIINSIFAKLNYNGKIILFLAFCGNVGQFCEDCFTISIVTVLLVFLYLHEN